VPAPGRAPSRAYRARPRLRRRRSAGLSLRGFCRCFEPEPAPAVAVAARWRIGARRRASRQMKNEMPPSRTIAPSAIAIVLLPLSPPLLEDVVGVVMIVGVEDVGTVTEGCGKLGASGFDRLPWARAAPGSATAAATAAAITAVSRVRTFYASGCSIAGVSGAST
jgi:hypothetical protein